MKRVNQDFSVKKEIADTTSVKPVFVSDNSHVPPKADVVRYNKYGKKLSETQQGCVAKTVTVGDRVAYWALQVKGTLYDGTSKIPSTCVYVTINGDCFDMYIQFLSGRVQGDYEKAVRKYRGS